MRIRTNAHLLGWGFVALLAVTAVFITILIVREIRTKSEVTLVIRDVTQLLQASVKWADLNDGRFPFSLEELTTGHLEPEILQPGTNLRYHFVEGIWNTGYSKWVLIYSDPLEEGSRPGTRIVGLVGGAVDVVSETEFRTMVQNNLPSPVE